MRLSIDERHAVEPAAREALPHGSRVLLFSSRTDDSRRGGNIDLLVELPAPHLFSPSPLAVVARSAPTAEST